MMSSTSGFVHTCKIFAAASYQEHTLTILFPVIVWGLPQYKIIAYA